MNPGVAPVFTRLATIDHSEKAVDGKGEPDEQLHSSQQHLRIIIPALAN